MDQEQIHAQKLGKRCKACGHPEGAHGHEAVEEDWDEPGSRSSDCSIEHCACREFRE